MKKTVHLLLCILIGLQASAQSPGGVSGAVLWLKGNTATDGSSWADNSGFGNDFSQPSAANQPVLAANLFNFNPAFVFDGAASHLVQPSPNAFPAGNSDRTVFVVASANATASYKWIFTYGTPGFPPGGGTFQMGNFNGALTNAFYGSSADISANNYWDAPANAQGAMATFSFASNVETQYDRGFVIGNQTPSPAPTLTATSTNAMIGALGDAATGEFWSGNIAEIILFPTALSDADRSRVESYLALKYGFTLGGTFAPVDYIAGDGATIYWTGSPVWQNDVFGIGIDNSNGFSQFSANSSNSGGGNGVGQPGKGNLVLTASAPLSDGQFLMIGNDGAPLTEGIINTGQAPAVAVGSQRIFRNWKVQNTGGTGAADLSFDVSGLTVSGTSAAEFFLMVDQDGDGDYNTGTPYLRRASSITGSQVNFTGINFSNGAIFTVITQASALLPALWESFTVTVDKNKALLQWKTSSEVNVDHYTVEYGSDGTLFTNAGTVSAKNGSGTNVYNFIQDNLPGGTRYYRIRRSDKDGRSGYSDIRSVRVGVANNVMIRTNPVVSSRLELDIDVQQSQSATVRIVSLQGSILSQQASGLSGGANRISMAVGNLPRGNYLVQVQLGKQVISKKFARL